MKNIMNLMVGILFFVLFTGCTPMGTQKGGTDTGPAIAPESGDSGGSTDTSTRPDTLALFSKTGIKDENWLDTDKFHSLNQADFTSYAVVDGKKVFATDPVDTGVEEYKNLNSHYFTKASEAWTNYSFMGKMKVEDATASAGVTFLSQFPYEGKYYRLRRYFPEAEDQRRHLTQFHITYPDNDGIHIKRVCRTEGGDEGKWTSKLVPSVNTWYRFEIKVTDHGDKTEIQAWIWPEELPQPIERQIHCFDSRPERLKKGTVGIWHGQWEDGRYLDAGRKYYDDFSVKMH